MLHDIALPVASSGAEDAPRTLIETAYHGLRRAIIDGKHPPNEPLRVEHLKKTYQVSAGTLREALALLVSDALVVTQGYRGFKVAPMSLQDLADLCRVRTLIECEAVRESMQQGKDDWEAEVVAAYHKLSRAEERVFVDAIGGFDEWEVRNREFHEALVCACSSGWLRRMRAVLYQLAERYRRLSAFEGAPPQELHDEHAEIYAAVMARDLARTTELLDRHIHHAFTVIRASNVLK
jgi:DNA-binding GntR family transcriptional regulator